MTAMIQGFVWAVICFGIALCAFGGFLGIFTKDAHQACLSAILFVISSLTLFLMEQLPKLIPKEDTNKGVEK